MKTSLTIVFVLGSLVLWAQSDKKSVVIGTMTSKPNALLIVNPEYGDQGVLLPQLSTAQRIALTPASPEEDGLIVFDTNIQAYFFWSRGAWVKLLNAKGKKTSFFNIDPAAFQELKPNDDIRHDNIGIFEVDNTFITAIRDLNQQMIAPVQLPDGAEIKELRIHYMDNSSSNIKVYLLRKSWNGPSEEVLTWESTGASASSANHIVASFNGMEVIDLENYTYRVLVQFDIGDDRDVDSPEEARQRLYGVRIKYEQ